MSQTYDALIIGAGHNGLTCGAYLARAGMSVLVLERRGIPGGVCVTEEVFPGYRVPTTSYVCSLLSPKVVDELELKKHGYEIYLRQPSSFSPLPDDRYLLMGADRKANQAEIAKFSSRDAERYPRYEAMLERVADVLEPMLDQEPPDPAAPKLGDLFNLARTGHKARKFVPDIMRLFTMSASDFLDRWFESEELKATLATDGVIGAYAGPRTPGTAYVLFHHVMGNVDGHRGVWGYVKGGMGGITQAMVSSGQARGMEVRTNATVAKILVDNGRAVGVALEDGTEIRARVVASCADPNLTFLKMTDARHLPSEFLDEIRAIRYDSAVFKINLALDGLPDFKAYPGSERGPQHNGTLHFSPTVDFMERAWDEAKAGKPSTEPIVEATIPTVYDKTLAPDGKHVMTMFVQYAPYKLTGSQTTWTQELKDDFVNRCVNIVEQYAPGFKSKIAHVHSLSPADLEREYSLTGGNIFHGAMTIDQLLFMRPAPGWARYRTPIRDLYLCGSGAHPGGGVMAIAGRNAARAILADRGKKLPAR